MATRPFRYLTKCVSANGEDINAMRDVAVEVSYRTMRRRCGDLQEVARSLHYRRDFPLSGDPYVAYYRSVFRGELCYYLVHSSIEYIWTCPNESKTSPPTISKPPSGSTTPTTGPRTTPRSRTRSTIVSSSDFDSSTLLARSFI